MIYELHAIYRKDVFGLPAFGMNCSEEDGDIDAIGVCEMSRYKRSLTRSFACLKKSTASS